jgi:hypothetical protein
MSEERKHTSDLPDPFAFGHGNRVQTPEDWRRRRKEMLELIVDTEYGGMPPKPAGVTGELLNSTTVRRLLDSRYSQYRIVPDDNPACHFRLDVLVPAGKGPFPVALNGDGCWRTLTDDILLAVLRREFISAQFSRVEVVPDSPQPERNTGLYAAYPGQEFGALSAWAWGYHRCVDFLLALDCVDANAIAATGHSRGGKAALLAGATDERIALTAPNDSGSGGAGSYHWQGPASETVEDNHRAFEYWYGPKLWQYLGRPEAMPFDQHFLKAAVAPRALLSTEGLADLWANPEGTWQTFAAAREVYRFLGAEENIGVWYREGGHDHGLADWTALLDFAEWRFRGKQPAYAFDSNPFSDLPRAFTWAAPVQP